MSYEAKILSNNEQLLAEISMNPSAEIIENRFSEQSEAAKCSGKCDSGAGCIGKF